MNYDRFAEIALEYDGTAEIVKRNEIDLSRKGRHMARLRDKGTVIAIRLPWSEIDTILGTDDSIFYVTSHYEGWPYVLTKIDLLEEELAKRLIKLSWEVAPHPLPRRQKS